ncbi:MAG TPA: nuclear transport factor 2 family protein [Bacteroidales bacterium]|nr:nuclear transport factor 2 family protein [Bacteroidales bacterium]
MKSILYSAAAILILASCNQKPGVEELKTQVYNTEKAFEKMTAEKSIEEAFWYYADDSAVIKRANDTVIKGKENIRQYYKARNQGNASVSWTPDFIETSGDGTLAYTYGKYKWVVVSDSGDTSVFKGVFHTVWRRQPDGTWRYVWD